MADPIQVEVVRGGIVEAVHTVHAVAVRDGEIVAEAGDPRQLVFLRSAAKPIQVLPLVRARPDLDDREIAIACSSHLARPEQLEIVRRASGEGACGRDGSRDRPRADADRAHLLGQARRVPAPLSRARLRDAGYRLASHPLQVELLATVAAAADVDPASIDVAIDGCGVPTFALPLDRCAHAFARLPHLDGGSRVVAAIRAYPEMLRGPIAADAMFVSEVDGWVAKGGAEGLFCAGSPDGLGIALKVEDGAFRAIRPALAALSAAARDRDRRAGFRHGRKQPRRDRRGASGTSGNSVARRAESHV